MCHLPMIIVRSPMRGSKARKEILVCPACNHEMEVEAASSFEHNGVYYMECPKCHSYEYFDLVEFLRECFWCGKFSILKHDHTDREYWEYTGRSSYICYRCGATEGERSKKKKKTTK